MKQNKVCVNIDQTDPNHNGFTEEEKAQARQNIGAVGAGDIPELPDLSYYVSVNEQTFTDAQKEQARTNISASDGKIPFVYYNESTPTPIVEYSAPAVVESEQGARIQNADASKKYFVATEPTSADKGKYFGVTQNGVATWMNGPEQFVYRDYVNLKNDVLADVRNDFVISYSRQLDTRNGRYPTKVIGHIDVNILGDPVSGAGYTMSVVPTRSYHHDGESGVPWDPISDSQIFNAKYLNGGIDGVGDHVNFMFDVSDSPSNSAFGIKYLTLKGQSAQIYDIYNMQIMQFYDDPDPDAEPELPTPVVPEDVE